MAGALSRLRVLDLSRVLAGPWAAQNLADLGADVIKVERPGRGDDTRAWGPPFIENPDGSAGDSGYFASVNRGKRSVTIDIASPRGQALVRQLAARADVLIENYKVGTLERYGLGYAALSALNERLVYCSVTGFGQHGPYAQLPGYDFVFQGMGGIMSYTGAPDSQAGGGPAKVGMAIVDAVTGMYATIAIMAALEHRHASGRGQYIDLGLLDCAVALNSYHAVNYFLTGSAPARVGNAHPHMVPYNLFDCADGQVILAIGNDTQFASFCRAAGRPALADDPHFATVAGRQLHRDRLVPAVAEVMRERTMRAWFDLLGEANVPCGPVYSMPQVFDDEQVRERAMRQELRRADGKAVSVTANPIRLSETPVGYALAPPLLGEHTDELLGELGLTAQDIAALRGDGIV